MTSRLRLAAQKEWRVDPNFGAILAACLVKEPARSSRRSWEASDENSRWLLSYCDERFVHRNFFVGGGNRGDAAEPKSTGAAPESPAAAAISATAAESTRRRPDDSTGSGSATKPGDADIGPARQPAAKTWPRATAFQSAAAAVSMATRRPRTDAAVLPEKFWLH